ncbi:MAG: response regulator [SAR202 cluster bacterium]|nr:response regulator [SAR202 cluster bacterium]
MARRLIHLGYHVEVADDGHQVWWMLNQNRYGCILLDLRMPGLACQDWYRWIVNLDPSQARY